MIFKEILSIIILVYRMADHTFHLSTARTTWLALDQIPQSFP
jgi:hypothetical protein